jgi:hypothetical protein
MNRKFSEVLEDYLEERDLQNSDYYDNRFLGDRTDGRCRMIALEKEMNEMIHGVEE